MSIATGVAVVSSLGYIELLCKLQESPIFAQRYADNVVLQAVGRNVRMVGVFFRRRLYYSEYERHRAMYIQELNSVLAMPSDFWIPMRLYGMDI